MSDLDAVLDGDTRAKTWIKAHLDYPHKDWCLLWPFGRIQSGYAGFGRPWRAVHRVICEAHNGPPPSDKHQATHSCGRGHDACVNRWHLSWKTNAQNQEERYQHSGPTPRCKLTPEKVIEIKGLKDLMPVDEIAAHFGVIPLTIHRIHAGKLWNRPSSLQRRIFTEAEVAYIRSGTKRQIDLAKEFNVPSNMIQRIAAGTTYKYYPLAGPVSSQHRETPINKGD